MVNEKGKFSEYVSFKPLRITLERRGITTTEFARMLGLNSRSNLGGIFAGENLPNTGTIMKMCKVLECSIRDIVEFKGIEVAERFRDAREVRRQVYGLLTYDPLKYLLKSVYGDDWQKKRNELYDKCKRDVTEAQREARKKNARKMNERVGQGTGEWLGKVGLAAKTRAKLNNDEPVRLMVIYRICEVLHCTPDWIVEYI